MCVLSTTFSHTSEKKLYLFVTFVGRREHSQWDVFYNHLLLSQKRLELLYFTTKFTYIWLLHKQASHVSILTNEKLGKRIKTIIKFEGNDLPCIYLHCSPSAEQAFREALWGDSNVRLINESKAATALEGVQWTQEAIEELEDNINGDLLHLCFTSDQVSHRLYIQAPFICAHIDRWW